MIKKGFPSTGNPFFVNIDLLSDRQIFEHDFIILNTHFK